MFMEQVRGFQDLSKVDDALRIFLDAVPQPRVRTDVIDVQESMGRFLAVDVVARRDLPPFDVSIVDGYAVLSEDVHDASEQNPTILSVAGESKLGSMCRLKVGSGQAVAVATGSMVPVGADSIAMVEQTKSLADNKVEIRTPTGKDQNLSKKGEDIGSGQIVLAKGRRVRPEDIGVLKALGVVKIQVMKKQRVAIISTGNELVSSPTKNDPAKVVDTNRPILSAMIQSLGAQPVDLGIARDHEQGITAALRKGLRAADVVLVTAGSSVGRRDLVPRCINRLGKPGMLVHGIAMRPAMPTGLAIVKGKPVVSLPGFPVSAMIAFRVFVRPLTAKLSGVSQVFDPTVKAVLKERVVGGRGLRTFVRVAVRSEQGKLVAEPLRIQRSSVLTSMINANGIITIPETNMVYEAGEEVEVSLIGEI